MADTHARSKQSLGGLTQDDIPDGTTAKQFVPTAVAMTGGTSTDVVSSDTVTSGALVVAGAAVGPAPTTQKWSAASAASASSPGICGGVAVAAVGATDLALKVQSVGITGVIADALWDSLPATSDAGKPVYLSKTVGHYTLDVSAYVTTDRVQSLGILHAGGTGACRIKLAIGQSLTALQWVALLAGNASIKDIPVTALTFTPAYLTGATDATSVVATWQAVTAGSFAVTIDGTARTISGLNFSTDTTMALVASRIQAAIRVATSALETFTWSTDHFVLTSASTANTSAVTVTSATGSGTDISGAAGGSRFLSCNSSKGVVTARAHGVYTLLTTDRRLRLSCTATDPVWLLLPTCTAAGDGKQYIFVDTGYLSATNVITLVHNGAETIANVAADITLAANGGEIIVTCDLVHTNWTKNVGSMAQLAATPTALLGSAQANAVAGTVAPPSTVNTNTYTPVLTDAFLPKWMTYAGASAVTLPQDSDLAFPIGSSISFKCANAAGKITFAAGSGATLVVARTGCASLIPQNPWGEVYKSAANTWELIGPFVG